ncbi:hypothetical protein [Lysobacter gummosus]
MGASAVAAPRSLRTQLRHRRGEAATRHRLAATPLIAVVAYGGAAQSMYE